MDDSRINALLKTRDEVSANEILALFPEAPRQTVYSRIRKLINDGQLQTIGKGLYTTVPKLKYVPEITPEMRRLTDYLNEKCIGVNYCISEKNGNYWIDLDKQDIPMVSYCLKEHGEKVITEKEAQRSPVPPAGYVILGKIISEMPMITIEEMNVSSLEKDLIDQLVGGKLALLDLQKKMEAYAVNVDRMRRYAARRGVSEELSKMMASLDRGRLEMISAVQKYFRTSAVTRAWVFGSFARGEETPESDLDLLVDYDEKAQIDLLDTIQYSLDIKKSIRRDVDLVENGYLRPFAIESANKDKYMIYAR